ncbi:MAG: 3-hydroxybutyryl-CoA dehydrogenase [Acidobacteriia bacterium]|nr:3-hydroxybutyryl-CoA dehydrogenase [Terriglobia bacterium]
MELHKLGIVGGGMMGRSIAEKVAAAGIQVILQEVSDELAERAHAALVSSLDEELRKWGITASEKKVILGRIGFVSDVNLLADTDMIIETVTEELESKKRVMAELGGICPPDRIFITNTSTLSITEIAAASGRPDRVIGLHFLPPVSRNPIVEVVRGIETSKETFATAMELARVLDKTAIEVFEYPGFVATRAIVPLLNEAIFIVMEGVANAEDVDLALKLGYQFQMGPLEYCDRIGLDKVMAWMEHLFHELGDVKYRPCPLLRKLVRAGHLGRSTGRGFFAWDGRRRVATARAEAAR